MTTRDDSVRAAAVRGTVTVTTAASVLFLLMRLAAVSAAPTTGDPWAGGVVAPVVTAAAWVLPPLVVLTLVRVLAHPRRVALPARSAQAAATGAAAQLACLTIALAAVGLGRVTTSPSPLVPVPGAAAGLAPVTGVLPDVVAVTLALVTALTVTAGVLRWRRVVPALVALPAGVARPDLVDDAASSLSRLSPGGAGARAAGRVNRSLDRRRSRPRRHRSALADPAVALRLLALTFRLAVAPRPRPES